MGLVQGLGDLHAVAKHLVDRKWPARDALRERFTLQQFHDQVVVTDVIERADVRMVELRDGLGLALEPKPELRVLRELRRQNLDGHAAVEPRVASLPHLTHAARANARDDLIRAEPDSGRQTFWIQRSAAVSHARRAARESPIERYLRVAGTRNVRRRAARCGRSP